MSRDLALVGGQGCANTGAAKALHEVPVAQPAATTISRKLSVVPIGRVPSVHLGGLLCTPLEIPGGSGWIISRWARVAFPCLGLRCRRPGHAEENQVARKLFATSPGSHARRARRASELSESVLQVAENLVRELTFGQRWQKKSQSWQTMAKCGQSW